MGAGTKVVTHWTIFLAFLGGCSAPVATLDLITVARKALTQSQEEEKMSHADLLQQLKGQTAALDQAFDADVKLVAAGQIKDASGKPIEMTPEWIISARKGYAAARDLISKQGRSAESAHLVRLDNLKAADEALEMASQLIVQQLSIKDRVKQHLINVQRSLIHGR